MGDGGPPPTAALVAKFRGGEPEDYAMPGMLHWMRMVIGMEPDRDMLLMFGTVHVVYSLVLGAVLGAGVLA